MDWESSALEHEIWILSEIFNVFKIALFASNLIYLDFSWSNSSIKHILMKFNLRSSYLIINLKSQRFDFVSHFENGLASSVIVFYMLPGVLRAVQWGRARLTLAQQSSTSLCSFKTKSEEFGRVLVAYSSIGKNWASRLIVVVGNFILLEKKWLLRNDTVLNNSQLNCYDLKIWSEGSCTWANSKNFSY